MGTDKTPKKKYPYLPWWLYDYQSDSRVLAMSDDQDLAYRRMIEASWDLGELPNDPEKIASLIRFSQEKFDAVWKYPLTECWHNGNEGLINYRLEREREKVAASYKQKREAGIASGRSRRGIGATERSLNGRSTNVERALNDPDPDSESDGDSKNIRSLDLIDPLSIQRGSVGAPSRSDRPDSKKAKKITGRVKWNKEEQKLNASDSFKQEFLACWKREFTVEEITEEMVKATRWLVKKPEKRGSKSRIDLFLHNWMEKALQDRVAKEEDEATMSRPIPEVEELKWCPECRETLPYHVERCSIYQKQLKEKEGGKDDGYKDQGRG